MGRRKTSVALPEIATLIAAFNALPTDEETELIVKSVDQRYWDEVKSKPIVGSPGAYVAPDDEPFLEELRASFGPDVFAAIETPNLFTEAAKKIKLLIADRSVFRYMVEVFHSGMGHAVVFNSTVEFGADGLLKISGKIPKLFSRISPERIRICKIDAKIFWAKKSNAWTCSTGCATRLGNQKRLAATKKTK